MKGILAGKTGSFFFNQHLRSQPEITFAQSFNQVHARRDSPRLPIEFICFVVAL